MERIRCEALSETIAARMTTEYPDKVLVSVSITGPDGDYQAEFDDGTGIAAIYN
jgi:hypothetical protein